MLRSARRRWPILVFGACLGGCSHADAPPAPTPISAATIVVVSSPSPSSSPSSRPTAQPVVSASASAAAAQHDTKWKKRCVESVEAGLRAAAGYDRALEVSSVRDEEGDEVSVSEPMGFFLTVRKTSPDLAPVNPPGIWQHRAESLHGSYHVMYVKEVGLISASIAFDGWASPRVQPLLPILLSAVDTCFID